MNESQPPRRALVDVGWRQGVLISPLTHTLVFAPARPVSAIAKSAAKRPGTVLATHNGDEQTVAHAVAYGIPKKTAALVIISQTCDIAKPLDDDPNVFAMRVFTTNKETILKAAASNSSRHFLLDADRGLVVDGTTCIVIEKPLLEGATPQRGATDVVVERKFARWLARRLNRPALPDAIVEAIVQPILTNLRALQERGLLDEHLFSLIAEVRLRIDNDQLPYRFSLAFLFEDEIAISMVEGAFATLMGMLTKWISPEVAVLRTWAAMQYSEISVADYFASDQFYLDEYSYRGGRIVGLLSPQ